MMFTIKNINCRKVLNSHVQFTNEYTIELTDGSIGTGSAPKGETISIYEDRGADIKPEFIINKIKQDGLCGVSINQKQIDDYLEKNISIIGAHNVFALSVAFFEATNKFSYSTESRMKETSELPTFCLNILNGGKHAYTNPIISDFHEYLIVPKRIEPTKVLEDHEKIQTRVREILMSMHKVKGYKNLVNRFEKIENEECLRFLNDVLEELRLRTNYDLMIDAAGTDLWNADAGKYWFSLTDRSYKTSDQLYDYWLDLIKKYDLRYLEDPFHEKDIAAWSRLTKSQSSCCIIGDDLYSGDARKIAEGADREYSHGVMLKPDQAHTVSATINAIRVTQNKGQLLIMSHRSIGTESTFLSKITYMHRVGYIKNGPMYTDYSAIIRFNELIRLTGTEL